MIDAVSRLADFSVMRRSCRCSVLSFCLCGQKAWRQCCRFSFGPILNDVLIVAVVIIACGDASLQFKLDVRAWPEGVCVSQWLKLGWVRYFRRTRNHPKAFFFFFFLHGSVSLYQCLFFIQSGSWIVFCFFCFLSSCLMSVRSQSFKKAPAGPTIRVHAACYQENAHGSDWALLFSPSHHIPCDIWGLEWAIPAFGCHW